MGQTGVQLQPLVDVLREAVLAQQVIHADETSVHMLAPGEKKTHRAYVWAYCTTPFSALKALVYDFNRLRHDKPARKFIKQARWLLLSNPGNLRSADQQVHLQDLLAANQSLMTVYLMKAELKALWSPTTAWGWRSAWKQWLRMKARYLL